MFDTMEDGGEDRVHGAWVGKVGKVGRWANVWLPSPATSPFPGSSQPIRRIGSSDLIRVLGKK